MAAVIPSLPRPLHPSFSSVCLIRFVVKFASKYTFYLVPSTQDLYQILSKASQLRPCLTKTHIDLIEFIPRHRLLMPYLFNEQAWSPLLIRGLCSTDTDGWRAVQVASEVSYFPRTGQMMGILLIRLDVRHLLASMCTEELLFSL